MARHVPRCVPLPSNSTASNQPNSRKSSLLRPTTYCAVLCSPAAKTRTRHRPASTCAPAPLLGRRRAVLLHVALLAPSATHMHAATAGPRAAAARPFAAAAADDDDDGARPSTVTIAAASTAAQGRRPRSTKQHLHQRVPHVRRRVGVTALRCNIQSDGT
mgnify:CR=1 FL=1